MTPRSLGIGGGPALLERRAGEGLDVGPVDGECAGALNVLGGDGRLDERVDDALEDGAWPTVGGLLGQRGHDEGEGPLHLSIREHMEAPFPGGHDAESVAVALIEGDQRAVHAR